MELPLIYAPVQEDLDAVEALLREELGSDDPFIGELVGHVLRSHGKMIRPALVCLSALACALEVVPSPAHPLAAAPPAGAAGRLMREPALGRVRTAPVAGVAAAVSGRTARLEIAGAVELIHVASLVHDDVIDAAGLRRGQATVNAVWGNQVAVLLGDYLFSKAFHMLARLRRTEIAAAMAWATVRMSQAEIKQIKYGNTPHTDEAVYFDIIEGKTAQLMSAACRCGALAAGASAAEAAALAAFGLEWGMAFQITDDALDLTATAAHLGKPIGSDIQTGKVTLPVIHALRGAAPPDRARLRELLSSADSGPHAEGADVPAILSRSGAIDHALAVARARAGRAAAALEDLRDSPARDSLLAMVEFVTVRSS